MLIYIVAVALSVPIATPLSVLAGFLFGTAFGTVLVVFSATAGATAIFILARYLFRDFFSAKAERFMATVKLESTKNGFRDILIARLIPAVPFSVINIVAGLTHVRLRDYVLATVLGIVPFSFVYVHAGTSLAEIQSVRDIASTETAMILSRIGIVLLVLYVVKHFYSSRKNTLA